MKTKNTKVSKNETSKTKSQKIKQIIKKLEKQKITIIIKKSKLQEIEKYKTITKMEKL